ENSLRIQHIQLILLLLCGMMHQIADNLLSGVIKMQVWLLLLLHPRTENRLEMRIQRLQHRYTQPFERSRIAGLLILPAYRDDHQLLPHIERLCRRLEARTGEDGLTRDQALVKADFADRDEKDIAVLHRLFYFPGEHVEAELLQGLEIAAYRSVAVGGEINGDMPLVLRLGLQDVLL